MSLVLTKQEIAEVISSLQKYFREELEEELSDMRAKFLFEYFLQEIAPLAYNQGVKDAEAFFRAKVEDLPGACFEEPLAFWRKKKK